MNSFGQVSWLERITDRILKSCCLKYKMNFVYILYSIKFGRFYVGMSKNIERRLKEHNSGNVKSTKAFIPWELVFQEEHETRIKARKREKYLKSAAGCRWRKNYLGM